MSQQFSMRMTTIAISPLDNSLPFLYKTLGTYNRISGVHEFPISTSNTSPDLQRLGGVLSLNR
jgi:hypothetical protein